MPNQPDFTTAGAAVANTLQDILTRRTAEKRQGFLDQLNQQNLQHEWDYKDQQASSLADERAATAEQRREQSQLFGEQEEDRRSDRTRRAGQDSASQALMSSPEFAKLPPLNQLAIRYKVAHGDAPSVADFTAEAKPALSPRYKINKLTGNAEPILGPDGKALMGPENAPFESYGEQPQRPPSDPNDVFGSYDVPTGNNNPDGTPEVLHTFTSPRLLHNSNPGQIANTPGIRIMGGGPVHKGNEPVAKPPTDIFDKQAYTSYLGIRHNSQAQDSDIKAARANVIGRIPDPHLKADINQLVTMQDQQGGKLTEQAVRAITQPPPNVDAQQYQNTVVDALKRLGSL